MITERDAACKPTILISNHSIAEISRFLPETVMSRIEHSDCVIDFNWNRVDEAPFRVTQEFLAQMIGVQRPALSVAMRQFKDAGLVRYARGQITIADRDGLLARSCGCTNIIASEARRLDKTLESAAAAD
jgi:hypothetical protein